VGGQVHALTPTDGLDLRGPAVSWSALAWAGLLTLTGLGLAVLIGLASPTTAAAKEHAEGGDPAWAGQLDETLRR
jgi:hypothetical protein